MKRNRDCSLALLSIKLEIVARWMSASVLSESASVARLVLRCILFPDRSSITSLLPDLSTRSVADLSGETNFSMSAAKLEAAISSKTRKREVFIGRGRVITCSRKLVMAVPAGSRRAQKNTPARIDMLCQPVIRMRQVARMCPSSDRNNSRGAGPPPFGGFIARCFDGFLKNSSWCVVA
jgi:hypothetical protein